MSDLQSYLDDIEEKMKDLIDTSFELAGEWGDLLDSLVEERWDRDQFKKAVFKTYEYFKTLYERSNILEGGYSRLPLDGLEVDIIAKVYAYSGGDNIYSIPIEDDYECYASRFIAHALYTAIYWHNLRPWRNQELYTIMDEFEYYSPDGERFMFIQYDVKTGDMAEIVDSVKQFDESRWLYLD